jgi:MFS family permease
MLIVARAVAGAGGSGIVSGIMTIIAHVIPLKERAGSSLHHWKRLHSDSI